MFGARKTRTWQFYQNKLVRLFKSKAALFLNWFDTSPAENYIVVDLTDRANGETYYLTLQRVSGKTPAQVMEEQNAKLESYRATLQEIGELAWDVRDPNQAKARIQEISALAGIIDET